MRRSGSCVAATSKQCLSKNPRRKLGKLLASHSPAKRAQPYSPDVTQSTSRICLRSVIACFASSASRNCSRNWYAFTRSTLSSLVGASSNSVMRSNGKTTSFGTFSTSRYCRMKHHTSTSCLRLTPPPHTHFQSAALSSHAVGSGHTRPRCAGSSPRSTASSTFSSASSSPLR